MANELTVKAWSTQLGNLTAKSVLGFVCDGANGEDGCCFPSDLYIAKKTEIGLRTVARMIEVFESIGLIRRFRIERHGKEVRALQVSIAMLGGDLRAEFKEAYAKAQKKQAGVCRSDSSGDVAATVNHVAATQNTVAATVPPHPHKGGTVIEPSGTTSAPAGATGESGCDFDPEQLRHLDGLTDPAYREAWKQRYREQNEREAAARAELAEAQRQFDADLARLKAEIPDVRAGAKYVMRRCGFVWSLKSEMGALICAVLEANEKPPWQIAPLMAEHWLLHRRTPQSRLRIKYGPAAFFRDGHWIDPNGWHWAEAR